MPNYSRFVAMLFQMLHVSAIILQLQCYRFEVNWLEYCSCGGGIVQMRVHENQHRCDGTAVQIPRNYNTITLFTSGWMFVYIHRANATLHRDDDAGGGGAFSDKFTRLFILLAIWQHEEHICRIFHCTISFFDYTISKWINSWARWINLSPY